MRSRLLISLLLLGAMLAAWFAVRAAADRRFQIELGQAEHELASRRPAKARQRLIELARQRPGDGEVEYLLGCSEMAGGNVEAALEAWTRVPPDSPKGPMTALAQGRHALDAGHYERGEAYLERATQAGGEVADEAGRLLEWLYFMTGRRDEYRGALHRKVEKAQDPSEALRALWGSDYDPYPVDGMTEALTRAHRAAPQDERVWLALADLATRSGRFDEADDWLRRCERSRPEDPAVWRARLEWARAAGRVDEFARAASRLPASRFEPAEVIAMRAWLAARNADIQAERSALRELIALEPGRNAAIERLADLAAQAGDLEQVAELRRRKAALEAAHKRYAALIILPDPEKHATELAREAEALGRWFDARAWWKLAARENPALRPQALASTERWARTSSSTRHGDSTLAETLGLTSPAIAASAGARLEIPTFVDEAKVRGLEFTFDNGTSDNRQLPETMSGGVAVLDFDGDGWLDIYAVQGGPFPPSAGARPAFGDRLFRNLGDGRFQDVTAASGLAGLPGGYGHGVAVGDYDNDGLPDLFVTRWRSYALYHNLGRGRFEDATERAGLGGDRDWPTSAAWADLDNDGDLDLYVCHYLKWDAEHPTLCDYPEHPERGHAYCDPRTFPALADHLFRNDGGRFVDATCTAGVVEREGRGLGVVAADLDGDGKADLFVTNDTTSNDFFHNLGDLRFSEGALEAGLASSSTGGNLAGMGIACGDFDGDGRIDLAVTNFFDEATTLYHNHGEGLFSDRSAATGLAAATRLVLGFGLAALDANNDGWLDLVQANGHVIDNRPRLPYAMPAQLLLGDRGGRFVDVSGRAGEAWKVPRLGRGLAVGDLDNDGRIDVLLVDQNAPLALLRNQAGSNGHFLSLALEGTASNRDAVGARVAVTASGRTMVAVRFGGGSYLSSSDPRLHFGLGPARIADRVEVTWPSGRRDSYRNLAADAGYRLREGGGTPEPLRGFGHSSPNATREGSPGDGGEQRDGTRE